MAKAPDVPESAKEATTLAEQAAEAVGELAKKGTPNEPDGLMVTVLTDLSEAVTKLGQAVEALAKKS